MPRQIGVIRRWIDQGARATPDVARRAAAVGSAARACASRHAGDGLGEMAGAARSIRRVLPGRPQESREPATVSDALFARRVLSRHLGPAAVARGARRRSSPIAAPGKRERARPDAARRQPGNTLSTGSRSGTICCATRTASRTSRRPRAARASRAWLLLRRSSRTCPTTSSSRSCSIRPRPAIPTAS